KKGRALARPPAAPTEGKPGARALFRPLCRGREGEPPPLGKAWQRNLADCSRMRRSPYGVAIGPRVTLPPPSTAGRGGGAARARGGGGGGGVYTGRGGLAPPAPTPSPPLASARGGGGAERPLALAIRASKGFFSLGDNHLRRLEMVGQHLRQVRGR